MKLFSSWRMQMINFIPQREFCVILYRVQNAHSQLRYVYSRDPLTHTIIIIFSYNKLQGRISLSWYFYLVLTRLSSVPSYFLFSLNSLFPSLLFTSYSILFPSCLSSTLLSNKYVPRTMPALWLQRKLQHGPFVWATRSEAGEKHASN